MRDNTHLVGHYINTQSRTTRAALDPAIDSPTDSIADQEPLARYYHDRSTCGRLITCSLRALRSRRESELIVFKYRQITMTVGRVRGRCQKGYLAILCRLDNAMCDYLFGTIGGEAYNCSKTITYRLTMTFSWNANDKTGICVEWESRERRGSFCPRFTYEKLNTCMCTHAVCVVTSTRDWNT